LTGKTKERGKNHEVFSTGVVYSRGSLSNDQEPTKPQ
jgi:hypothetical protein